ncbi:hypothetical protein [Anthocerotibacter panamensis]|uniref:hypothetical protein n=1 Tax=Anthocerotibacter panamensis TaxID=2857077 RepID=UPI001C4034FF|nr:hypothetical protein [Anthocerotibacter panamensis]
MTHNPNTSIEQQANLDYLLDAVAEVQCLLEKHKLPQGGQPSYIPVGLIERSTSINPAAPLETLCHTFNLTAFERKILLLCVGMALIPSFGAVCAHALGDSRLAFPTLQLALSVFADSHVSALLPEAPLQRWQLLHGAPGPEPTLAALHLDRSILYFLLGEPWEWRKLKYICVDPRRQILGLSQPMPAFT